MLVNEIMTRVVKTITPETRLQEVASIMCLHRLSSLPVVDGNDKLVGILSEQDVLKYLFPTLKDILDGMLTPDFEAMEADYKKVLSLKSSDLMSSRVITVRPDTPILQSASVMAKNNFRRIPVADVGKLVGMISLGDIHRAIFMKSFSGSQ